MTRTDATEFGLRVRSLIGAELIAFTVTYTAKWNGMQRQAIQHAYSPDGARDAFKSLGLHDRREPVTAEICTLPQINRAA